MYVITMNEEENTNDENIKKIFMKPPIIHFKKPENLNEITLQTQKKDDDQIIQSTDTIKTTDDMIIDETEKIVDDEEQLYPIAEPSLEIIGTAHISDESVKSVREMIYEKRPEIVAIELDMGRYQSLMDEKNGIKHEEKFDLKTFLQSSNITITIVSALLSHMQAKMGDEVGVKPGSEMLEAIEIAQEVNADVALIDRSLKTTLQRTINAMTLREKLKFGWSLLKSLFMEQEDTEEFKEEIEELKQDELVEEAMEYFKEASPGGYNALVHERDAYMAYYLKSLEDKNVVAVVGAGHQSGIRKYLSQPETIPPIDELNYIKEKKISIMQVILYLIPVIFILIFIMAYINGINIEGGLMNYLIFAGGGAFLGSIICGSKVKSAFVGMIMAPITTLHPLLAAGWFSGLVEGKERKVGFDDLSALPKCESFKELWHNKLFRVILVVLGTNLGATIGVLCIINNVFWPYLQVIFGI